MPNTIAENLTRLQTARTNIATAITGKGGTVASGAGFEDFPTAIGTIPAGGGDDSFAKLVDRSIVTASIPSGVTKIGAYVFSNCRSLTSVTIPNTVTTIDDYGFYQCAELADVTFPTSSLLSIGHYAFQGGPYVTNKLTTVTLPSSVSTIGNRVFAQCRNLTYLDLSLTSISSIGEYLASEDAALQTLKLPAAITSIGRNTCYKCSSLTSVTIPSGVTSIGISAFDSCTSLTSIVIPANVVTISPQSLYNCTSLTSIKFEGSTPPAASNSSWFSGVPTTCTIQVPTGSLTAYTTANNYPNPNTYTYVEY